MAKHNKGIARTFYAPPDIILMMRDRPEVNWSEVIRKAIEGHTFELDREERYKERNK